METIEEVLSELETDGYVNWYNDIDATVAQDTSCEKCGSSMSYTGLQHPNHVSKFSFAICGNCGHWIDF